jgi:hypothetical protein
MGDLLGAPRSLPLVDGRSDGSPQNKAKLLATDLADATDELNEILKEAEQAFFALKLGVEASVTINSDEETAWMETLSFGKYEHAWKLMVNSGYLEAPDWASSVHVTSASRATRLQAAKLIPALYDKLLLVAESQIASIRHETATLREFTRALSKAGDK